MKRAQALVYSTHLGRQVKAALVLWVLSGLDSEQTTYAEGWDGDGTGGTGPEIRPKGRESVNGHSLVEEFE